MATLKELTAQIQAKYGQLKAMQAENPKIMEAFSEAELKQFGLVEQKIIFKLQPPTGEEAPVNKFTKPLEEEDDEKNSLDKIKEGDITAGKTFSNDESGTEVYIGIDRNKIEASLTQKFKLFDFSSPSIPLFGPVSLRFTFVAEFALKTFGKIETVEKYFKTGLEANLTFTGKLELLLDLVLLEAGADAAIHADFIAKSAVCYFPVENKASYQIDNIKGMVYIDFTIFLQAGRIIRTLFEGFGGNADVLRLEYPLGKIDLFEFTLPMFKDGKLQGELNTGNGSAIQTIKRIIEPFVKFIQGIQKFVEWVGGCIKAIAQFIGKCIDALIEAAKKFWAIFSKSYAEKLRVKALQDEAFKQLLDAGFVAVRTNKRCIAQLQNIADEGERYAKMSQMVTNDPGVKAAWKAIENKEFATSAEFIAELKATVKTFTIHPSAKEFVIGNKIEFAVVVESDHTFPATAGYLEVGIRCNGQCLHYRTVQCEIKAGHWECVEAFELPLADNLSPTSSKNAWEVYAKLDLGGDLKDQEAEAFVKVVSEATPEVKAETPAITQFKSSILLNKSNFALTAPVQTFDAEIRAEIPQDFPYADKLPIEIALWCANEKVAVELQTVAIEKNKANTFNLRNIPIPDNKKLNQYISKSLSGAAWKIVVLTTGGSPLALGEEAVKMDLVAK